MIDTAHVLYPSARQIARDELIAECKQSGITRAALIDYCADHGVTSPRDFIDTCERVNSCVWSDRIAIVLAGLTAGVEAA